MIVAWLSRTIAVPEAALRLLISVLVGELREISRDEKIPRIDFPFIDFSQLFLSLSL